MGTKFTILLIQQGPLSPRLLRINATIINRDICNGDESYAGYVKNGMFCAGNMAGGIDACTETVLIEVPIEKFVLFIGQGDSGGGLICGNFVAGIVSWGVGNKFLILRR